MTEHDTETAGAPAPAVSSRPGVDIVPEDARRELERIRTRWGQLPLARAEDALPGVRAVLDDLAVRTAGAGARVPDLGAACAVDQLAVLVWDACAAGPGGAQGRDDLTATLADLRRSLP